MRQDGALLIVAPQAPGRPLNRLLSFTLDEFLFKSDPISSLSPYLGYALSAASECKPQGYGYAGPAWNFLIPSFALRSARFEDVVAKAAEAPMPTTWVVQPDEGSTGCMEDPGSQWKVALYGFGAMFSSPETPILQSSGPPFIQTTAP